MLPIDRYSILECIEVIHLPQTSFGFLKNHGSMKTLPSMMTKFGFKFRTHPRESIEVTLSNLVEFVLESPKSEIM